MVSELSDSAPPPGDGALDITLLGGAQVLVGGEPATAMRSGRARSLLAYLVLHPEVAHARERLAFLFWPDSSEAQARTNLRNVLHTLRQSHPSIDACLDLTPSTMQWRPGVSVAVDVDRFAVAADAAADADPDDADELIALCRTAVELYAGDLLEGDDDEWLVPLRHTLRDRYRRLLSMLATALIDDGRPGEATSVARALVGVDAFDESAHRLRMEAHHAAGDRAGAVRAFHECVVTLEGELGVEPGADTMALYASLIARPHDEVQEPRQAPVRARRGLVGRETEWGRLIAAWDAAQLGPPAVALVTGEAGVGKTKIVDELRTWCSAGGAAVGDARSYVTEGDLGYSIVASWLRSPDIADRLQDSTPGERTELARLLPELGTPGPAEGPDDAVRRRRLFDTVVSALTATGRPTLLVADDAQWSDPASQELVHYLVRQPVGVPLLVVLTARHDDLDAGHPLTALRDELVALDRLIDLHLERLPRHETAALGGQLLGAPLDDAAADTLFAESEGNPLFVVETVRAGWDGTSVATPVSPKLRAVIDSRLRRLSDTAMTIARTAAVAGRPCSAALLGQLTRLEDMALAQGLDELWRRGVLCESGTNAYEFSHGKLRDVTYDELSPALRSALHAAAGDALTDLARHDPELSPIQVAVHFEAAQRFDDAVTWFQEAALDARQMFAHAEAVRLIDRALALVPALPAEVRHTRELELLSTMPAALAGIDGYDTDQMSQAQQRAVRIADDLGVELDPALGRSMVMTALCRNEFDDAARSAEKLLTHAVATGDTGLRLESHYLLGIAAFWDAALDPAREHFETVVADFDPSMRPRHHVVYGHDPQVVCLSRLANTLWFLGREDEARSACDDAQAMAVSIGHPWSHDTTLFFASMLAVELGDHEGLRRTTAQLGEMNTGSAPNSTKLAALRGLVDVLDGNASGIDRVRSALEACNGRDFFPGFRASIMRLLLAAHALAGDATGGIDASTQALSMDGSPLWKPEAHRWRAEFLHRTGAATGAITAELDGAEATAHDHGAHGQLRRIQATRERLAASAPTV